MGIYLGWGTISDPLFGVKGNKINAVEWTFDLYKKSEPNTKLTAWIKTMFDVKLAGINEPWAAWACHISFLASAAKATHAFHIVIEVYSKEKVANAMRPKELSRVRPDTSQDANFRLVYQYNSKGKFLHQGHMDYSGPDRPPGIDTPQGFEKYREAADKIAAAVQ